MGTSGKERTGRGADAAAVDCLTSQRTDGGAELVCEKVYGAI